MNYWDKESNIFLLHIRIFFEGIWHIRILTKVRRKIIVETNKKCEQVHRGSGGWCLYGKKQWLMICMENTVLCLDVSVWSSMHAWIDRKVTISCCKRTVWC